MRAENKKKLEEYSDKLYKGLRKQYKESGKYSGRTESVRIQPTIRQHNTAIDNAERRCVICDTKYDDAPSGFDIHHVDGNREHTDTSNLILLCTGCHRRVHDRGGALMDDYRSKKARETKYVEVNDTHGLGNGLGRIIVREEDTEIRTDAFGQKNIVIKQKCRSGLKWTRAK